MTRIGLLVAVIIIIVASVFFGFREAAREHAAKPAKPHPAQGTPLEEARLVRKLDPASRELLLAHLARAGRETPGVLADAYVRTQLQAVIPHLRACHAAGTLTLKLVILGEPEIGGLIETSEVVPAESTIAQPEIIACVRETLAGLEFVAPQDGGRAAVTYPFAFSAAGD